MPCNEQLVKKTIKTEITDGDVLRATLEELQLNFRENGNTFVVTGRQYLTVDGEKRMIENNITISLPDEDDKDAQSDIQYDEEDEWAVDIIRATYAKNKIKKTVEKRGGRITESTKLKNGGWLIKGKAKVGDAQTVTMKVGANGDVDAKIAGGDLDVCNPLSHALKHELTGDMPDHEHDWAKMGYKNWAKPKTTGTITVGGKGTISGGKPAKKGW